MITLGQLLKEMDRRGAPVRGLKISDGAYIREIKRVIDGGTVVYTRKPVGEPRYYMEHHLSLSNFVYPVRARRRIVGGCMLEEDTHGSARSSIAQ